MKKIIKIIFSIIIIYLVPSLILGLIWYKLEYAKITIGPALGIDIVFMSITEYNLILLIMLSAIEFILIHIFYKKMNNKQIITYFIASTILSIIFFIIYSIGPSKRIDNYTITSLDVMLKCLGTRYNYMILVFNIPTLLSILILKINKKKKNNE